MPLPHLNNPLYGELGKISSFEEGHEDAAEDGHGAPGIRSHNLFRNKHSYLQRIHADEALIWSQPFGRTHQSDFLNERIAPLKRSKEELSGFISSFIVELHHRGLKNKTKPSKMVKPKLLEYFLYKHM